MTFLYRIHVYWLLGVKTDVMLFLFSNFVRDPLHTGEET